MISHINDSLWWAVMLVWDLDEAPWLCKSEAFRVMQLIGSRKNYVHSQEGKTSHLWDDSRRLVHIYSRDGLAITTTTMKLGASSNISLSCMIVFQVCSLMTSTMRRCIEQEFSRVLRLTGFNWEGLLQHSPCTVPSEIAINLNLFYWPVATSNRKSASKLHCHFLIYWMEFSS